MNDNDNFICKDEMNQMCHKPIHMSDIDDISLFVTKDKDVLKYDSVLGKWTNKPINLTTHDLGDMSINRPKNEEALVYDSEKSKFVNKNIKLVSLDGIKVTNPMVDQILRYDGEKWINKDEGSYVGKNAYRSIKDIAEYLYELEYDYLDYAAAFKYFKERFNPNSIGGACTSIRKGNWYGRNYDWYYDNNAIFVTRVTSTDNRYASLGVGAGSLCKLDNKIPKNRIYTELYKYIPFVVLDGINEKGVIGSLNVVPYGDGGYTTGTVPEIEKKFEISGFMLLRFVLDNFATAKDAVEFIRDYVSVYVSHGYPNELELHFIFADERNTYLLEFINNKLIISEPERTYMTNFYITGSRLKENWTVDLESLTPYADGVERYNYITRNINNVDSEISMRNLMKALKYTNAYDINHEDYWWSELCGKYEFEGETIDLTITTDRSEFIPVRDIFIDKYNNRDRNNPETWQTVHSSVYDIYNRRLNLCVQESDDEYTFDLKPEYTKYEIEKILSNIIAETFDDNKSYDEGSIVIYQNKLYKFIVHKRPGLWNQSYVTQVTISSLIN